MGRKNRNSKKAQATIAAAAAAVPQLPVHVTDLGKVTTKKKVVVSIDFGTTYSGVGIAYRDSPERVNCGAPGAHTSRREIKVPTVLLRNTRTGEWAFGNQALEQYHEAIVADGSSSEGSDWDLLLDQLGMGLTHSTSIQRRGASRALFRNFKMELKNKTSGFDTLKVKSECGRAEHSLMDLIAQTLRCLSNFALETLNNGLGHCLNIDKKRDVQWVVTVPAIWNDFGKQFMRKAAHQAGMVDSENSENVMLALEPESAAFAVNADASDVGLLMEDARFMVLDCGGGTVDITVHRVATHKPLVLDEVGAPTGGPWGGIYVDKKFEGFLSKLVGERKFQELQSKYPKEVSSVVEEFRVAKENYIPDSALFVRVSVADIFNDEVCDDLGIPPLEEAIRAFNTLGEGIPFDLGNSRMQKMMRRQSVLSFNDDQMKVFFEETLSQICTAVTAVLEEHPDCRTIALVGGYGSSRALCNRVRSEFERAPFHAQVFVPDAAVQPQAAIMHGSALYGLCTSMIGSRIARYTYGIAVAIEWILGVVPPTGREVFNVEGVPYLDDNFSAICTKGSSISPIDKHEVGGYKPIHPSQVFVSIPIFKSIEEDPVWTDDEGCEKLGEIRVPLLDGTSKCFSVQFTFTTELIVEVVRDDDGKRFRTSVRME